MAAVNWDKKFSVGVDSMDDQHKVLFDIINDIYDSISKKSNNEIIFDLIVKMRQYTVKHFTAEENYLEKTGYHELEIQKKEHKTFVDKIEDLEKRFKSGKAILTFEVTSFLKTWLVQHIEISDKKYGSFLVSKGIN